MIALAHDSLHNYYYTNFQLAQHHKYSLTELEYMIPWEREIYVMMLLDWIKEQEEEARQRQLQQKLGK